MSDALRVINKEDDKKEYKIRYQCNFLPSMSEDEGLIITAIAKSEELEIFKLDVVQDLINYKWASFAAGVHWFGWSIHIIYIIAL